jgi:hypothetical protein
VTSGARWSIAGLLILLLFVGFFNQGESWELTETTHGSIPGGYGALYRLLLELDLTEGRSYERASQLARDSTLWWIAPAGLCEGLDAGPVHEGESGVWRALEWIERGGTGVLFLPDRPLACLLHATLDDAPFPVRGIEAMTPDDWREADGREEDDSEEPALLVGEVLRSERNLDVAPSLYFDATPGFDTLVADETARPFVIARGWGSGRLVIVASSGFLQNRSLDRADAAPLSTDLVLAFGHPLLDEREHGLLPSPSPIPYLLQSAALPAFAIAGLLAWISLWGARAEPAPTLEPYDVEPPSLEAFVDSIATLYASTRDHPEVLRSYQEFALSQLRRHFLLPPDTAPRVVCERLRASRGLRDGDLAELLETQPCRGRADQIAAIERLDAILARAAK